MANCAFGCMQGLTSSSRKEDKKVQSIYLQCETLMKRMEDLLTIKYMLNRNQCTNLYMQLVQVMKVFDKVLTYEDNIGKIWLIFVELHVVVKKSFLLLENCGDKKWCEATIFQMKNKESFREILLDLVLCCNAGSKVMTMHYSKEFEGIARIMCNFIFDKVEEDDASLYKRLVDGSQDDCFEECGLIKYLLQRWKDLGRIEGGDLDALELSNNIESLKIGDCIGEGANGVVYRSRWFGILSATKKIVGIFKEDVPIEVGILAALSHPNLVKYFFAAKVDTNKFGERCSMEGRNETLYLVTELMDMSLVDMLKKKKSMAFGFLIDIMYQVAKGMCYLHDMQIAHRDLKPDNILVNFKMEEVKNNGEEWVFVKISDFGTSKSNVGRTPKSKSCDFIYGTPRYMAPEVFENEDKAMKTCAFEADVFSFAMTCSEILSRKKPFSNIHKQKELWKKIKEGERPELPSNCDELIELIEECWSLNPSQRPKFGDICERLASLKTKFLIGFYKDNGPLFSGSKRKYDQIMRKKETRSDDEMVCLQEDQLLGRQEYSNKLLELCKNGVKAICLIGMGGIGKTTMAKFMYNDVKGMYDASCFVENMQRSENSYTICCYILKELKVNQIPETLEDAQVLLKSHLRSKKTILVFDDVKEQSKIRDIVPMDEFCTSNGSTLIVTTRSWNCMKDCSIKTHRVDIAELEEGASLELFISYSHGKQVELPRELDDVGKKIVKACNGLPLSLKVMGAFLRGQKRVRCWERALQRLKRARNVDGDEENSDHKIWTILRISFDQLKVKEKDIFLDICCFFTSDVYPHGMSKERALRIWTNNEKLGLEQDVEDTLDTLINHSLVKIDENRIIRMHDHLRDMGRMIVETNNAYKDTRIWKMSMVQTNGFSTKNIMQSNIGDVNYSSLRLLSYTIKEYKLKDFISVWNTLIILLKQSCKLKSLMLCIDFPRAMSNDIVGNLYYQIFDKEALEKLQNLTVLQLKNCKFIETFPNSIFLPNILLELDLEGCSNLETLPKSMHNLTLLRVLNLKSCTKLKTLPISIGNLISMQWLSIKGCDRLTSLPKELNNLKSLTTFDISGCMNLTSLPKELGNLTTLTSLYMSGCANLTSLPKELGNLTSLTTFDIERCENLTSLPKELGNLTSLTKFNMSRCKNLTSLPKELGNLTTLTVLYMSGCENLTSLPKELGNLTTLTSLYISGCENMTSLPKELGNLTSLTTFYMNRCKNLTSLPKELVNLTSLTSFHISGCENLTSLPKELGNLTSLTTFDIERCENLTSLPKELGNLTSLTIFNMSRCKNLTSLPEELGNLTSLTKFYIERCENLTSLPKELDNITSLTLLCMSGCANLTSLPKELGNLTSLISLYMSGCANLTSLPKELGNLTSLKIFDMSWCENLTSLPKELGNLTSLTSLYMSRCANLTSLPKELGNLTSLTSFHISGCENLTSLPKELGNLTSLTSFNISGYENLTSLPKELDNLTSLTSFYIERCENLTSLPKVLGNLTSLTSFYIERCENLTSLPKELGNFTSLTTFDMIRCKNLTSLPKELGNLTSLTIFDMSCCKNLTSLPKDSLILFL
uniref:Protein kinase domain-containing protein n=1 Tax=Physcomitrium patens TaxID=3218 RepID=A0A2K1IZR7_PHYPA|nr:hypothetical protein PHYPA_022666 [Physcomitrium patens]